MIGGVPTLADQDDFDDCCCEEAETSPGYLLEHASKACPHLDCDGTADDIYTTPDDSNLTDAYDGKYTRYDGKCWLVTALVSTPGSPTTLTVSGNYATKALCCDPCYNCGDCEFHPDSYIDYTDKSWTCVYSMGFPICDPSRFQEVSAWWSESESGGLTRSATQCYWRGTVKNWVLTGWEPDACTEPTVAQIKTLGIALDDTTVTVSYDCDDDEWYVGGGGFGAGAGDCTGIEWADSSGCVIYNQSWNYEVTISVEDNSGCDQDGAPWKK